MEIGGKKMAKYKTQKMKDNLISASKSNKSPPIWVLQKTESMRWHPHTPKNRSRNWRRTRLGNRIRKKMKKSKE